ncbi:MAG: hypothetical protein ACRD35_07740, partial [Candidatus Acidiferrales bacterium]
AEQIQALISILLGLATFYSAALGVGAYLGIQHAVQQAEKSAHEIEELRKELTEKVDRINEEAKKSGQAVVDDIRREFPPFRYMGVAIRRIMDDLKQVLPRLDWTEHFYSRLTPEIRQKIAFYERTVAAFGFLDLHDLKTEISQIYQGLGNFYGLKYHQERKQSREFSGDLERSRFYLDLAILQDDRNFGALNDRAYLAVEVDSPSDLAKAKACLERSLQVEAAQQRARYNLAIVEHREKNYSKALSLLSEALGVEKWQETPSPRHRVHILYNRACALARLAEKNPGKSQEFSEKAIADLKEFLRHKENWDPSDRGALLQDLEPGGDLYSLKTNEPYASQLAGLLQGI